jgi:DNA modification methylase
MISKLSDLSPAPFNPRSITEDAIGGLAISINEFGDLSGITFNRHTGNLVCGHMRVKALTDKYGDLEVADNKITLPTGQAFNVRIVDWPLSKEKAANIAANNHHIAGDWTSELGTLLDEIKEDNSDLFSDLNFDSLFDDVPEVEAFQEDGGAKEDEAPEVADSPVIQKGDLILLGKHRVLCGDSTNVQHVDRLMDGKKADMVFTDPPYNTGMSAKTNSGSTRLNHMFNDSFSDEEWHALLDGFTTNIFKVMNADSVAYICLDWRRNHELIPYIKKHFKLSNIIVWDKVVHGLGSDYKYSYELINVAKKGNPNLSTHQGEQEYQDVWHIQRKVGRDEDHATKKPLELIERCCRHGSKQKNIVVDLFLGSGSTLIACEQTNRTCYGMELSEAYCQVVAERYINLIGGAESVEIIRGDKELSWQEVKGT